MNSNAITNGILKALAIIAGIGLLLFFLYKVQAVIVYITIAAVTSLIGRPIVAFLRRRLKFKNTFAVVVTMTIFIGFLFGLIRMFIPLIIKQGRNLSLLDIDELQAKTESLYVQISDYFAFNNIDIEQALKESNVLSNLNYSIVPEFLNSIVNGFGSFGVAVFSILFITFFLLKDSQLLEQGILVFVPDEKEVRSKKSFEKIKALLSRYFIGLIAQISILFVIYTTVLLILGIDNAIVIAFLCALLNLIPYVGPLISGILMVLLTMTSNLDSSFNEVILPKTIWIIVAFAFGQLIDNFISQPVIFSKSVKSHPLEIFLIIIIAGLLFGVIGMIVAVPAYTALKVILKEFLSDNKIVKQLTQNL